MEAKKILVAINGSNLDTEVIQLACTLAKRSKGKVFVTYVIQLERTLPLDAEVRPEVNKAEGILSAAESYAEKYDYEISTDLLQARAIGPALINEASERNVDLIIMGTGHKIRFGEFTLGDIVPHVLKHSSCRVLLLQGMAPSKEILEN